jgi:hypothetical protein
MAISASSSVKPADPRAPVWLTLGRGFDADTAGEPIDAHLVGLPARAARRREASSWAVACSASLPPPGCRRTPAGPATIGQHQQNGADFDEAEAALASLHVSHRLVMSSFSPVPPTWLSAPSEKMSKGAFWPGKR